MLRLKQITKDYPAGGETVKALRGIDLTFRKNEFVAILGPSGCGKTTLLNIVGGLDGYTSGDLLIEGRSTKDFKDRDWDAYRNHSIGFVFQSYNLIPHQTVLSNVSLALTLAGESKAEARRRASAALDKVGLETQKNKRPAEMSGGQMQRVAIARAIVNDPEIILADEPTGALDTATGIQVMEILSEISKERLVVMVTHNPELAAQYATRIVRMRDGVVIDDTNPYNPDEEAEIEAPADAASSGTVPEKAVTGGKQVKKAKRTEKKPSMSLFTAFGLSLNNLFTKKGRTILTSFAGSIGIIGIALIYAVSNGASMFINSVQEETLTAYPLTLESETVELSSLIETFMGKAESNEKHDNDAVYQKAMIASLVNTMNSIETSENDLKSFKLYIEERMKDSADPSGLRDAVSGIQYTYGINLPIYTENTDGKIILSDVNTLMRDKMLENWSQMAGSAQGSGSGSGSGSQSGMSSMLGGSSSSFSRLFQEMLPGKDGAPFASVFYNQYDLIYGSWPNDYNEIVLVVDENNEIADLSLYALGLIPEELVDDIFEAMIKGTHLEESRLHWSYKDICARDYRVIFPFECYTYDEASGSYKDLRETEAGVKYLYTNALKLRVSGIIRANKDAVTTIMSAPVGYTSKLVEYVVEKAAESEIVKAQLNKPETDIFSGKIFKSVLDNMTEADKAAAYRALSDTLSTEQKADNFLQMVSIPTKEAEAGFEAQIENMFSMMTREYMEQMVTSALEAQLSGQLDTEQLKAYIAGMSDDDLKTVIASGIREQLADAYAASMKAIYKDKSAAELAAMFDESMKKQSDEICAQLYTENAEYSASSLRRNLRELGSVDLDSPNSINLYASSFEDKDTIVKAIADYNKSVDEIKEIKYTDYVGIMMSSITTILNAITYVLISFVAISLIVSSIMIGVITLISVQERTKEIGILRAIGASKANVSSMFNAETVIIGFVSGLIGVGITYLTCIPINIIIYSLTDIGNLKASLPIPAALVFITISVLLTLIAGIIPSASASKKDPVVALRTE
ncbi:MAG: ABC transporter ATP-binding protein/permease [Clostridia bacterium]|nr:ABC transporter ATP-binding protein/permease [Clostridia bacterium]